MKQYDLFSQGPNYVVKKITLAEREKKKNLVKIIPTGSLVRSSELGENPYYWSHQRCHGAGKMILGFRIHLFR